jgi:rubrerythrin
MSNILEFANMAAERIERSYQGDRSSEFLVWLQIALRREAMVTSAYDPQYLQNQCVSLGRIGYSPAILREIRGALSSAWSQEEGHRSYLSAILNSVCPPESFWGKFEKKMAEILGEIEGHVMAGLTSTKVTGRVAAKIAVALARFGGEVPEFINGIRADDFSEYCLINEELELTAVSGYRRMLKLIDAAERDEKIPSSTTLRWDLGSMLRDELYHSAMFRYLSALDITGNIPGGVSLDEFHEGIMFAQKNSYEVEITTRGGEHSPSLEVRSKSMIAVNADALVADPFIDYLRVRVAVM